jgi:CubicO group peptidase (beta-lactamase class C family)
VLRRCGQKLGRPVGIVTFDAATKHDLRSIEKCATTRVLGIVIKQGRMAGFDQSILPQVPEYADLRSPQKDQITLRHLLTLSQGLAWKEDLAYSDPANCETQMDF